MSTGRRFEHQIMIRRILCTLALSSTKCDMPSQGLLFLVDSDILLHSSNVDKYLNSNPLVIPDKLISDFKSDEQYNESHCLSIATLFYPAQLGTFAARPSRGPPSCAFKVPSFLLSRKSRHYGLSKFQAGCEACRETSSRKSRRC